MEPTRPETSDDRFEEALIEASRGSPFLTTVLNSLVIEKDESVRTAAVALDPLTLTYAPSFFETLSRQQALGVLLHEVLHLTHLSFTRAAAIGAIPELWNLAADAVINDVVKQTTLGGRALQLPEQGVFLEHFQKMGYRGEIVHEEIYGWIRNEAEKLAPLPEPLDLHTFLNSKLAEGSDRWLLNDSRRLEEREIQIRRILEKARAAGWGNLEGDVVKVVEDLLEPPRVDWRRVLRTKMSILYGLGARDVRTWSRPSPRRQGMPTWREAKEPLVVVVDASGSVLDMWELFLSEVEAIAQDHPMSLVVFDVRVVLTKLGYRKGDYRRLRLNAGGGTDVQCVFDWLHEHRLIRSPVVILTDGYFNRTFATYGASRLLWAVTHGGDARNLPGDVLELPVLQSSRRLNPFQRRLRPNRGVILEHNPEEEVL